MVGVPESDLIDHTLKVSRARGKHPYPNLTVTPLIVELGGGFHSAVFLENSVFVTTNVSVLHSLPRSVTERLPQFRLPGSSRILDG